MGVEINLDKRRCSFRERLRSDDGAGQFSVPGRPIFLGKSRAVACCACSGFGWVLFGCFFLFISFLFTVSLSLGDALI